MLHFFQLPVGIVLFIFILGLSIGSFLNVCIFRVPRNFFFSSSRSYCPHCGTMIPFFLNIPLVSYLILKGKARCCRRAISLQYPVVELLTGLLFILIYVRFPFWTAYNFSPNSFHAADAIRFIHCAIFSSLLIVCSVIDIHLRIIPDKISLPMIAFSTILWTIHPDLKWQDSLLGVLFGGGVIWTIAWIYFILRKAEGIGMGDAKLLAAIGGWLGYQAVLPSLLLGSIMGSFVGIILLIYNRKMDFKAELPFGPFLAMGALFYYLVDRQLQFLGLYF